MLTGAVLLLVQLSGMSLLWSVCLRGIYTSMEARKSSPSVTPQVLSILFCETGSLVVLDLDSSTRLAAGHRGPGVCLLLPAKQPYDCAGALPYLAFHVFLFIIRVYEGCEYGLTRAPVHLWGALCFLCGLGRANPNM